jgi:TctA family transporter
MEPLFLILGGVIVLLLIILVVILMLKARSEKREKALIAIIKASQELGTTASLDSVLKIVVSMVKNLFGCGTVVIYLSDPKNLKKQF